MSINKFNFSSNYHDYQEISIRELFDENSIINLINTDILTNFSKSRLKNLNKEGCVLDNRNKKQEIKYLRKLIEFQIQL